MNPFNDVDICNLALASFGANPIESLAANKKGARACKTFYPLMRLHLLSSFDWNFARKFLMLTNLDLPVDQLPPATFAYAIPEDCIQVRKVHPAEQREKWETFGDKLYINREENVGIYYTSDITNTFTFSSGFAQLLSVAIAAKIAPSLSQDTALTNQLYQQYQLEMAQLQADDANAGNPYRTYDEDPNKDTFVNPDLINYS